MNTTLRIRDFTMHGSTGISVLRDKWGEWVLEHQNQPGFEHENAYGLGKITHLSWYVAEQQIIVPSEEWGYSWVLPDASGFICFERESKPDNCLLLDVYGKERMRLSVPWRMTGATNPEAEAVSTFDNISDPYINPADGKEGQFGVTGWVGERKYYFELDYHTGQFLWCKPIRD